MDFRKPTIAVIGHKNSGKTTVVEIAIKELIKKGYRIATAKHAHKRDFSIDTAGKDTWRHSVAGADPVAIVSEKEIALLIKNREGSFSLDFLSQLMQRADVIILEGFSSVFLSDDHVGKIFCIRNLQEYDAYKKVSKGEIIAFCSHSFIYGYQHTQILVLEEPYQILTKRILDFVEKEFDIGNKDPE